MQTLPVELELMMAELEARSERLTSAQFRLIGAFNAAINLIGVLAAFGLLEMLA